MVPLLKVAAIGAAGAGLCCLGWWISSQEGIPPLRDLSTDSDFNTGEGGAYKDKYASDYSKYFVGVHDSAKTTFKKQMNINDWWEWAFKNRYQTYSSIQKQGFKNKNTAQNFKEACKNAYQAEPEKIKVSASKDGEYEENSVWIFCSIGGNKPKSISEVTTGQVTFGEGSFGKNDKDKTLLISTKDSKNDWFWQIKEAEFFGYAEYPQDLGDKDSTTSKFKELYGQKENYKDLTHLKVKELCGQAYIKNSQTAVDFPRKVVFKFCSLSGKEPQSETVTQTQKSSESTSTKGPSDATTTEGSPKQ